MKVLKKIRKVLKSIIKITHKTKNTLKRDSALTNMAHCHGAIGMCNLRKVQNVEEQRKIEARSRNHCCRGKAISIKYYGSVSVALYIYIHTHTHPTCKAQVPHYIDICGLSGAVIFFHIISQTGRFFFKKEKVIEYKMCFDFLYNFFSETFLILRRTEQDIFINVHRSSFQAPVLLVRF